MHHLSLVAETELEIFVVVLKIFLSESYLYEYTILKLNNREAQGK